MTTPPDLSRGEIHIQDDAGWLEAADERLRHAETEVRLLRGERDLARRNAEDAAAARTEAERAAARTASKLAEIDEEKADAV